MHTPAADTPAAEPLPECATVSAIPAARRISGATWMRDSPLDTRSTLNTPGHAGRADQARQQRGSTMIVSHGDEHAPSCEKVLMKSQAMMISPRPSDEMSASVNFTGLAHTACTTTVSVTRPCARWSTSSCGRGDCHCRRENVLRTGSKWNVGCIVNVQVLHGVRLLP